MRSKWRMWAAVVALGVAATTAVAGSIWAKAGAKAQAIAADTTARRPGDLLAVAIREHSIIENEIERNMNKTDTRSNSVSGNLDLGKLGNKLTNHIVNLGKVDGAANTKFDGKADYGSDRSMTDKITVTVEDVLPNGNLVILGRRERDTEGDRQVVTVSGIVRPADVSFENEVSSDRVAEFHVVYHSKGQENRFTKPGWFAQVLNFINPF